MFCQFCGSELQSSFRFCPVCGNRIESNAVNDELELDEDQILKDYFRMGYSYENILKFLLKFHGIQMSLRTLQERFYQLGLKRRNVDFDVGEVRQRIMQLLNGPGCSGGYRSVWHCLQLQGLQVPRRVVEQLVRELDPVGCQERRAKTLTRRRYINPGPNYSWHTDGYDKLKPYGFPIHGCIDGFSRRIVWLKVTRTNNDPAITGNFFLEAVQNEGGCPIVLRSDNGTENTVMAAMQCYFRCDGQDERPGINAHIYGSSHSNQRIEAWWSYLRKARTNWWINFFKDLVDTDELNTADNLKMECLWSFNCSSERTRRRVCSLE